MEIVIRIWSETKLTPTYVGPQCRLMGSRGQFTPDVLQMQVISLLTEFDDELIR